jgi:methionine-rich copper-binding protein CopC
MRHLIASILAATIVMGMHTAVLAHSKMSTSVPAEGATIKPGLAKITLGFTKSVRLMTVKVLNTSTKTDVADDLKPTSNYVTSATFPVEPLAAGAHSVSWTAIAKDGHVMKGQLTFEVKE